MDQAVYSSQVHKGSKVHNIGDDSLFDLSFRQTCQDLLSGFPPFLLQISFSGENYVVPGPVELNYLAFQLLPHKFPEILDSPGINERSREETSESNIQNESTLDHLNDFASNIPVFSMNLLQVVIGSLCLCPFLG
ncbi:MAG: hypothetical protein DDT18_00988 [Actinobacteria bacterium]|nr:hypothetical protein [Actinomycetota bacterium]